jgi:hypothetical protein
MKTILRVLLIMISFSFVMSRSMAQWIQTNGPSGGTIRCYTLSGTNILAGTYYGIFISIDNGKSWAICPHSPLDQIYSLLSSGTTVYAGAQNGLYVSYDNGFNWKKVIGTTAFYSLAQSGSNIYAGSHLGFYRSTDNGYSWAFSTSGMSEGIVKSVAIQGTKIFAGTAGGVFISTNGGETWRLSNSGLTYTSITSFLVYGRYIFAGTGGGLFSSPDSGLTWTKRISDIGNDMVNSIASSGNYLYAGSQSGVHISIDSGATWTKSTFQFMGDNVFSIYTQNQIALAGTNGGSYFSTDNGLSWNLSSDGIRLTNPSSMVTLNNTIYTGTNYNWAGGVFKSSDRGLTWSLLASLGPINILAKNSSTIFAGSSTALLRSCDEGNSWTPVLSATIYTLLVHGLTILAGTENGIYYSSDNGTSFISMNNGLTDTRVFALERIDENYIFAGTTSGVFVSSNGGSTWSISKAGIIYVHFSNTNYGALGSKDKTIYATMNDSVFTSSDFGNTWRYNKGFPAFKQGAFLVYNSSIYLGTSLGVVVSTNSGDNWTVINDQSLNVQSLTILKGDLFAGIYNSGVWRNEFPKKPLLVSCRDVPNDQGANVLLTWSSSILDTNVNLLPYYSIWRAIPLSMNTAVVRTSVVSQPPSHKTLRIASSSSTPSHMILWEWIANQPAHCALGYSFTAKTLFDSTASADGKHYFMISAQTSDPNIFYDSNIDSVCSIDNISPFAPRNLSGSQMPTSIFLTWKRNSENDLKGYAIYRSKNPIGLTDTLTQYDWTIDTSYIDIEVSFNSEIYYAIRAEDIHGNMSPFSNQLNFKLTDVLNTEVSFFTYSLEQNYPNPFNPSTTISFSLPSKAFVLLKVFDLIGREVATLISREISAGKHSRQWNAEGMPSGIYFYRLSAVPSGGRDLVTTAGRDGQAGSFTETKKLILLR